MKLIFHILLKLRISYFASFSEGPTMITVKIFLNLATRYVILIKQSLDEKSIEFRLVS